MELKWLLYVTLLALGTLAVQAHDMDDDNDGDDVVDIEDDLDDGIEEVEESKPETSTPPPTPKVWHGTSFKNCITACVVVNVSLIRVVFTLLTFKML